MYFHSGSDEIFWAAERLCARDPLLPQEQHRHLAGGLTILIMVLMVIQILIIGWCSMAMVMVKKGCVIIYRLNWFRSRTRPILLFFSFATTGTSLPSRYWIDHLSSKKNTTSRCWFSFWCQDIPITLYHGSLSSQDPLAEVNMFTGMSKFAKIAWSLTR